MRGNRPRPIACEDSEKAPEISACEAITVATVASSDQRIDQRRRRHAVEQLAAHDRRAAEQIGALAEIVGEQGGKDDANQLSADRPRAEMSEVGVHRLAAGDDQHHRAEDHQRFARPGAARGTRKPSTGLNAARICRLARDLREAEGGDDDEPDDQQRPEDDADARAPLNWMANSRVSSASVIGTT